MVLTPTLRSRLLDGADSVQHAFFTRQGGVSSGLYASLNTGYGSADINDHVSENRRRAAMAFGAAPTSLFVCHQIHSAEVVIAPGDFGADLPRADAIVSITPGAICGALTADCAPVLLADSRARVVAAAHAGWRGALEGVVGRTVETMCRLGARPERIIAAVGPCIGQTSYEVGPEFRMRFTSADPRSSRFFESGVAKDKFQFDLAGFVLGRLAAAGVEVAEWIGRDTCADEEAFFSNRRACLRNEADYGRLLSGIMVEG